MDIQALLDLLMQQQGQQGKKPKTGFMAKTTFPLLLGGSLAGTRDTPGMRGISTSLDALALLSMLGK